MKKLKNKERITFSKWTAGVAGISMDELIWSEYKTGIENKSYPLDVTYFFMREKKFLRKDRIYLCLVSSKPGVLVGRAGVNIFHLKDQVKAKYPFITDIKIIESTTITRDPMSYYNMCWEDL